MRKLALLSVVVLAALGSVSGWSTDAAFPPDPMNVYGSVQYEDGSEIQDPVEVTAYAGKDCIGSTNVSSECHWDRDGNAEIFDTCIAKGWSYITSCENPDQKAFSLDVPNPDDFTYSSFADERKLQVDKTPIRFYVNGKDTCQSVTWENFEKKQAKLTIPKYGECDSMLPEDPIRLLEREVLTRTVSDITGFSSNSDFVDDVVGISEASMNVDYRVLDNPASVYDRPGSFLINRDDPTIYPESVEFDVTITGDTDGHGRDRIVIVPPDYVSEFNTGRDDLEHSLFFEREFVDGLRTFYTVKDEYVDRDGDGEPDVAVIRPQVGQEFEDTGGSESLNYQFLFSEATSGEYTLQLYDNGRKVDEETVVVG